MQWGHTSLVSTILDYTKLYFKSDDYIGWVSVPVPRMPNKYQILSKGFLPPIPTVFEPCKLDRIDIGMLMAGRERCISHPWGIFHPVYMNTDMLGVYC